jgi:cellulose synthase/poly-beta-1,6-N-acetylglucosamine synthase-like glycosyltransferase
MAVAPDKLHLGESAQAAGSPAELRPTALTREIAYTQIGIGFTAVVALWWLAKVAMISVGWAKAGNFRIALEDAILIPTLAFFFFGQLVYLFCRLGFVKRTRSHRAASRAEIESVYDDERPPPLTILIPSYCERLEVVRKTMLSAALLEYPDRRIVLLIDDPPTPASAKAGLDLAATREMAAELETLFRPQGRKFLAQLSEFKMRAQRGPLHQVRERARLKTLYEEAAGWLESLAEDFEASGHVDQLFVNDILLKPATEMRSRANQLGVERRDNRGELSRQELTHEYKRLAALFAAQISCFERKRFANLSHSASKAMNLNSYMGLIGRNFRTRIMPDGLHLEECDASNSQLRIPDAGYIIAVDADTLMVHDYALRLIHLMEQPENQRVAIAQSPHRAMPDSPILLERAVAAQTDLQRMLCQGSAHYGAAFWVGGSAVMRRAALEDVCEPAVERGYPIKKYIQDRTLVEDTESSLSFLAKGWSIHNYLDPLTYSVIPGDFGALIVQRRRWSSGGLLNLPSLGSYLRKAEQRWKKIPEASLRFHYLASTTVNLGMLVLPLVVTSDNSLSGWFLLSALVYYTFYARDLFSCGYAWIDLPRVYALNLMLIPVSINGIVNSIRQWWTERKPAFQRTPKIRERTAIPPFYVASLWLIPPATLTVAIMDMIAGGWSVAILGVLNALLLSIALVQFIGVRESFEDLYIVLSLRGLISGDRLGSRSPISPGKESAGVLN